MSEYEAKPSRVKDGDSLEVIDRTGKSHYVRLIGVDAPERNQPNGKEAADDFRILVYQRKAEWLTVKVRKPSDYYGRELVDLYDETTYLNALMIERGIVWYSSMSAADTPEAAKLQAAAKVAIEAKRGVYDGTNIEPWRWRQ